MTTERQTKSKPLVSIVLPAFNEAPILVRSIEKIYNYLILFDHKYQWEVLIINDGSKDDTGRIANELVLEYPIVKGFVN